MKRRFGKRMAEIGVSHWLLQVRKDTPEDAPLVVPKVTRQYTRKKKEPPTQPENKVVATATGSEQNVTEGIVDHCENIKKEEYMPDINTYEYTYDEVNNTYDVNNDVQMSGAAEVKTESSLQNCSEEQEDSVNIKEETVSKVNPSASYVSERECRPITKDAVKTDPFDDMDNTNIDQKNVAACHSNTRHEGDGKTVNLKSNIDNKLESYNILNKINMELQNNEGGWYTSTMDAALLEDKMMGQDGEVKRLQYKALLTEEINIKDESEETDSDCEIVEVTDSDCEIVETTKDLAPVRCVKEEPTCDVAPVQSQVAQPRRQILRTYGRKKDTASNTALKKCFLVAVNVETANSQKIVDPESLAGFKVVAKSQIFTCEVCSKHFLSRTGVRNHMRAAHTVTTPHVCHCGSRFPHHFMLIAHMRSHSVSGPLACDLCPKRFKSTQKYGSHLNTHLRERLYSCPVCMRRFTVLTTLYNHASRHTASDISKCSSCSSSFRCITDLRRHSERDHGEKVDFPCYICNQILSSNDEFIAHLKKHDSALTALHECAFCGKRLADYSKWEEHSKAHIEMIGYTSAAMRPYVCGVCRKRFEYRCMLKSHMSCHTVERPYTCKKCSKTFKTRSSVAEHEKGHSLPYSCSVCARRFAKRNTLSRHWLLHSGERPHVCPSCPRTFAQRSAMMQHVQRFHTPGLKRVLKKKGRKRNNPTPAVAD